VNTRNAILGAATCFFLAVVQLISVLVSPAIAIAGGVVIAALCFGILRFFSVEFENAWMPALIVLAASSVGTSIGWISQAGQGHWTLWLAPLAAGTVAAMVILLTGRRARRCDLCNRRIRAGDVTFVCPRCSLLVADVGGCWIHERLRCRLCEENQVPIFTADKRWWDRQFGPRVRQGRCQVTLEDAGQADLRACPHCGRLQSTLAWDMNNGQCARCGWTVEEIPESLQAYMAPADSGRDVWAEQRGRGRRRPSA
jgi:hypothetical protein